MEETHNNCFEEIKLPQAKIGKQKCCKVSTLLLFCGICADYLSPDEKSRYVCSTKSNCYEFLASDGLNLQNINQSSYVLFIRKNCGVNSFRQKLVQMATS